MVDCYWPASPCRHPDRSGGIAPCLQGAGYNPCKSSAFGWAKQGSLRTADGTRSLGSARDDSRGKCSERRKSRVSLRGRDNDTKVLSCMRGVTRYSDFAVRGERAGAGCGSFAGGISIAGGDPGYPVGAVTAVPTVPTVAAVHAGEHLPAERRH